MKNLLKAALLIMLVSVAPALPAKNIARTASLISNTAVDAAEAQKLVNRLEELKAMDKSTMTRSQKRAARNEVKAIQKTMSSGGGVYLSVGAVILIVILLIILL
jgi:hypothetical protein